MVKKEVERRIEKYLAADEGRERNLVSLAGSTCYGKPDLPKDEQIAKGIEHYLEIKKR